MNFIISIKHKDEGKHVQTIFLNNVEMVSSETLERYWKRVLRKRG